jgi:hypothetical protein
VQLATRMEQQEDQSDDDSSHGVTSVITPDEMLKIGLKLAGYKRRRIRRAKKKTNIDRFKGHFGSYPLVCVIIWEDLQSTEVDEARVPIEDRKIKYFLMSMHHLKRYPTELEREGMFDISAMWGRDWVWYFLEKIQALKVVKIVWPEDNFGDDILALTVDGTHCLRSEPNHPIWSQDPEYYSHKFNKAGLNYELGISLSESKLVWMNGPYKAGQNDVLIFTTKGLKAKLLATGKKAIGDGGYQGHQETIIAPNSHDSRDVRIFKSRALLRHEKFNGLTKNFDCLSRRFRHGDDRFKICFEAICVICQYQIENDSPLFDILVEDLLS